MQNKFSQRSWGLHSAMRHREEYKRRVTKFQWSILFIQLLIMINGTSIFILGVVSRPILRITRAEHIQVVRQIVNLMIAVSMTQILVASYNIFCGCWKLIYPLYLGIAATSLTVVMELAAIGSSVYLYTRSPLFVNEGSLMHPWYWAECLETSCHATMLGYIHWYVLPQVVLAGICIVLQCTSVTLLAKLVRTVAEHFRILHEAQEKYHEEWEEKQFGKKQDKSQSQKGIESDAADDNSDVLRTPKRVQFLDDLDKAGQSSATRRRAASSGSAGRSNTFEMRHTATAQIHVDVTPISILKGDHGYVRGSRVSLDIDKP